MKAFLQEMARGLGFAAIGVTTAEPVDAAALLREAIEAGRTGTMAWLGRDPLKRCDPASLLPGAKSVICCALAYGEEGIRESESGQSGGKSASGGKGVARFARGADYHVAVHERLAQLWSAIQQRAPDARAKLCVDTSPILEKALAARAGLGVIGKHTILFNRDLGSWFMLGEIVTDLELEPDAPRAKGLCGACHVCIDACPTKALVAPHQLDARRCISYLTLEHKEPIPDELRRLIPDGADGCDLCQEACPYNRVR